MKIEAGDIVFCDFPMNEGGSLPHYALVVSIETSMVGMDKIRAVYGSSQKVCASGALPHEFIISDENEMERAGLTKPIRFDLSRTAVLLQSDIREKKGSIDLKNGRVLTRLKRALLAAL